MFKKTNKKCNITVLDSFKLRIIKVHKYNIYNNLITKAKFSLILLILLSFLSSTDENKKTLSKNRNKWVLSWVENFNSNILDTCVWSKIPRGKSPWSDTMSLDSICFGFKNGCLILKGMQNPDRDNDTSQYITGGVWTRNKKIFGPGKFEIKAKLGAARGAWPAIWLMPDGKYDGQLWKGEIDIVEKYNKDTHVCQTLHNHYINILQNENPKRQIKVQFNPDDFNIFGVEIYQDHLTFFVNGKPTLTYPKIKELEELGQFPYYRNWYLIIDMQIGNKWLKKIDNNDLPVTMEIDWVKYYKLKSN